MSSRMDYIRSHRRADNFLVARAIREIATALDSADDKRRTIFSAALPGATHVGKATNAWAMAALILADRAEIDSVTLRAIAATIDARPANQTLF